MPRRERIVAAAIVEFKPKGVLILNALVQFDRERVVTFGRREEQRDDGAIGEQLKVVCEQRLSSTEGGVEQMKIREVMPTDGQMFAGEKRDMIIGVEYPDRNRYFKSVINRERNVIDALLGAIEGPNGEQIGRARVDGEMLGGVVDGEDDVFAVLVLQVRNEQRAHGQILSQVDHGVVVVEREIAEMLVGPQAKLERPIAAEQRLIVVTRGQAEKVALVVGQLSVVARGENVDRLGRLSVPDLPDELQLKVHGVVESEREVARRFVEILEIDGGERRRIGVVVVLDDVRRVDHGRVDDQVDLGRVIVGVDHVNDQFGEARRDRRDGTRLDGQFVHGDRLVVDRLEQRQFTRGRIQVEGLMEIAVQFVLDGQ